MHVIIVCIEIIYMMTVCYFSSLMSGLFLTVRRNLISVLFPTFCAWAIYADWSRTQKYKADKVKKLEAAQLSVL